ncbi:putative nucleotide exchange factor SIL1 [Mollisia scopiformis]|uniref:Nucleotide exchange factor SIL1 n=1 Tax=Mollisia scopiformis TaxID=149040 RepID=A0A194WT39_MOLSC|nr:putative nucleotide exchange factor SIL1 [Mollisia scopiformis]KUJ11126.1 putative nucleotide exchange factor SIL1 [Mollisia scopiformis]
MDIYAGTKEARRNIPMEGEEAAAVEAALSDLPVEQSIVVVDQPVAEEDTKPALRDQVPINPPTFDTAGKILPPPPSADGTEMGTFQKAMLAVKMDARAFDTALDDLMELSHDIYYGLEIAKDGPIVEKLICLTLGSGSEKIPAGKAGREHKAASILASSVQNNPTALKEIVKWGRMVFHPICSEAKKGEKPNFVTTLRTRLGREKDAGALKAKVGAISGLLHDESFRTQFLENSGMELLLAIFLKKGEDFDPVRRKVAQLVTDNFLDEGMGAKVGVWPKMPVTEAKVCKENKERMLEDGCWEYHVGAFGEQKGKLAWVKEFEVLLTEQREKFGDSILDREL